MTKVVLKAKEGKVFRYRRINAATRHKGLLCLRQSVTSWLARNEVGGCSIEVKRDLVDGFAEPVSYTFCFERDQDALLFKLTFGGE